LTCEEAGPIHRASDGCSADAAAHQAATAAAARKRIRHAEWRPAAGDGLVVAAGCRLDDTNR